MPTIDQYASDAYIRLLLQGTSGSGKTTTACQFPGAWIIDCDMNLAGPLRYLREKNLSLPLGYDKVDVRDDGTVVPENMRWQRVCDLIKQVGEKAHVIGLRTIVIDSMSKMNDYNEAHVLRTNPTKTGGMEMTSWGFYAANWTKLLAAVTAAKVNFVLTAHDKVDKDELDGSTRIFLNVPGKTQAIAGSLFTDVWHAEVQAGVGMNATHKFVLRTLQDYRYVGLKNSFGLPALFEFDWKKIEEKLNPQMK